MGNTGDQGQDLSLALSEESSDPPGGEREAGFPRGRGGTEHRRGESGQSHTQRFFHPAGVTFRPCPERGHIQGRTGEKGEVIRFWMIKVVWGSWRGSNMTL